MFLLDVAFKVVVILVGLVLLLAFAAQVKLAIRKAIEERPLTDEEITAALDKAKARAAEKARAQWNWKPPTKD
jgi:hypothetical protein